MTSTDERLDADSDNAVLRAVATELMDAAKAAESVLGRQKWLDGSTDPEAVALFKLRAAIAKATADMKNIHKETT